MNRRSLFAMLAGAAMAPFLPKPKPVVVGYDIAYEAAPAASLVDIARAANPYSYVNVAELLAQANNIYDDVVWKHEPKQVFTYRRKYMLPDFGDFDDYADSGWD